MKNSSLLFVCVAAFFLTFGAGQVQAQGLTWTESSIGLPSTGFYYENDLGDLNNDGNLDMVAGSNVGVHAWIGDGAGNWTETSSGLPTGAVYSSVVFGDVDHDGNLDILASSFVGVLVWLGDGAGNWTSSSSGLPSSGMFSDVGFADLNGDGHLDIVVSERAAGINLYTGDGAGSWSFSGTVPAPGAGSNNSSYFDLEDLDNDGNTDIVIANYYWGAMVFLGDGALGWTGASTGLTGSSYARVDSGDVNNDGNLDLGFVGANANNGVTIFHGDGAGNWTLAATNLPSIGGYVGIQFTDINGDGFEDVGVGGHTVNGLFVWLSDGANTWTEASAGLSAGSMHEGLAFGDVDNDGDDDLATTSWGAGASVFLAEVSSTPPTLSVSNLIAGQTATFTVSNATPSGKVGIAYSLVGAGPTSLGVGACGTITVDLSNPIIVLGVFTADAGGTLTYSQAVPAGTSGVNVWMHALDVGSCTLTNSLAETVG